MLDIFFYNNNTARFILFLKKSEQFYNFTEILKIKGIDVYFNIQNISDLNNLALSNYFFFFKYFFGKVPYFANYRHSFKLNVNYYSFMILCNFKKKDLFYVFSFFINDIFFLISKNALVLKKEFDSLIYSINDMNFFIEKKNSIGFFHLKEAVHFKFLFNNYNWLNFLNLFKLYKL